MFRTKFPDVLRKYRLPGAFSLKVFSLQPKTNLSSYVKRINNEERE